jgi:hypothetical protein
MGNRILGGGRADLPAVAGAGLAAPAQLLDAQEQGPGHDRGLLEIDPTRDAGGV